LAALHGGAAILLLFAFRGVTQAISVATDSITVYMEGGAYCLLIVMAAFLLVRAVVDLARSRTRARSTASLGTLILTGVYPCPGAILVLVLSLTLDITGIGILAVLAMSLGMSIPIAAFAYFGWLGRTGLLAKIRSNEAALRRAGAIIEIAGFTLLLIFSVYIALPFIVSLGALGG
jgi:ABC-type nickel/cobalt efflux system permease component RcnA